MAVLTLPPEKSQTQTTKRRKKHHQSKSKQSQPQQPQSSWDQIMNLITCKQVESSKIHDPSKALGRTCGSICSFKDVVHGNTRVVHDNCSESSNAGRELLGRKKRDHVRGSTSSSRSMSSAVRSDGGRGMYPAPSSSRGMQLRKLSGCYECHAIVDPSRFPSPRRTISVCSECGEVFPKVESLEHHQATRHAVSELGPEDSGRNIVEIIFKSSWLKKDNPIFTIERILKVHNTRRTIQRFEDCRDAVKTRATATAKKNPRCAADGNELLRFHCTTLACPLGSRGSSALCGQVPGCGVCTIIRHGFQGQKGKGVRTTASSGRAHDCMVGTQGRRAMLVCRVIAGKVRPVADVATVVAEDGGESPGVYDSVAGPAGVYSNLEELYVFNARAILPCFVVIYKAIES